MRILDNSTSKRLPVYLDMVRELSRATQPQEVIRAYAEGTARLDGEDGYISLSCRGLEPGEYRITRMLLGNVALDQFLVDTWSRPAAYEVHRGGLLGSIVQEGRPVAINELDVRADPVLGDALAGYGSLVAIPLFDAGQALNWAIQLRPEPDFFDLQRLEEDLLRGNLVGGTVRHVQTARQLQQANDRIHAEMERIGAIQRALLPAKLPDIPGVSMAASYETFDQAGGDMYLFHEMGTSVHRRGTPDGRWAIVVGDVSGHGPSAAVVMAMIQGLVMSYVDPDRNEVGFFEFINEHLVARSIENSFTTAVAAVLDPRTRRLVYSCAGHPAPILHRRGDPPSIASLHNVGNLPLGIMPGLEYPVTDLQLEPGDTLVFYTDGITEARAPDGEFFGSDGLARALLESTGSPARLVDHIKEKLHAFQAGQRPQDDQTLLVVRIES